MLLLKNLYGRRLWHVSLVRRLAKRKERLANEELCERKFPSINLSCSAIEYKSWFNLIGVYLGFGDSTNWDSKACPKSAYTFDDLWPVRQLQTIMCLRYITPHTPQSQLRISFHLFTAVFSKHFKHEKCDEKTKSCDRKWLLSLLTIAVAEVYCCGKNQF